MTWFVSGRICWPVIRWRASLYCNNRRVGCHYYTMDKRDLIFVSNRLPYSVDDANGVLQASVSSSDLVKALSDNLSSRPTNFRWFGWSGINTQDPAEKKSFSDALAKNNAVGIFLDEKLAFDYYHRFSRTKSHLSSCIRPWIVTYTLLGRFHSLARPPLPG